MKFIMVMVACLLVGTFTFASAQTEQTAPDNTKVNARDQNQAEPTADQQKENASDRDISRQIRQAIVKDKSLSTYAHNVKIVSQNGAVTLKGPVRSEDEKNAIEAKAAAVVGKQQVNNQLEVKPEKQ
jgi:hyperosmotically inducible periplasmic protein